jgi:single-strand DNA-binding protein
MRGFNQVTLIGNLGRAPEMRYTSDGKPVTTFSLATGRKWKDEKGELKEETTWLMVVCWNGLAEGLIKVPLVEPL